MAVKIAAEFVTSAATAAGFPSEGLAEIVLVGRSNVGKSSLINALVRRPLARTSGSPGKTRLANVYRVARGTCPPVYFVDLPGYGFARGGPSEFDELARTIVERGPAALFLVDARHPGLDNDRAAWDWLRATVPARAAIATKIDKLSRAERSRALMELDSVFEAPVLPVSAVTGEGLDELWKLIDTLANSNNNRSSRTHNPGRSSNLPGATAHRRRKRSSASSSRR